MCSKCEKDWIHQTRKFDATPVKRQGFFKSWGIIGLKRTL